MDEIDFNQFLSPDNADNKPETDLALINDSDVSLQAYDLLCRILDSSVLASMDQDAGRRLLTLSGEIKAYSMPEAVKRADEACSHLRIDASMFLYLFLADRGFSPGEACRMMGINKTDPVIWRRENKLFAACQKAIIEAMADEAEAMSISLAVSDPKANLERMFVVKAHKPQYRDNAPMPSPVNVHLEVTIDKKLIDASDSYRIINADSDEE